MNNEEYINKYWRFARSELKTLRRIIVKTNKRTQDKLQDLFDSLKITYADINRTIPKQLKEKLLRKIEEWKENKTYKGFFEYKTKQLLRGNITYRSYIEIMLMGIYMEEMSKIDELATATYKTISMEYLNRGRKELGLEPRTDSILPELLFMTVNGLRWVDYLSGLYVTNAEEIEKEYTILMQAGKEPNVNSSSFQKIFAKQINWLVNIKDDEKYSGGIDEYATAYANESYLEASEENQKVMFVSDLCENVTKMCRYMDGMIFNTKDKNVFRRPFGRTLKELKIEKIITKGLVVGVNMPPINYHFHWCHSTFTYQIDKGVDYARKNTYIYKTVTNKWLENRKKKGKVMTDNVYYEDDDGTKYNVDGANVIFNPSNEEIDTAQWLVDTFGGNIRLQAKVKKPEGIKTPDYKWNNEKWDYKEPIGGSLRTLEDLLRKKEGQADNFIIDVSKMKFEDTTNEGVIQTLTNLRNSKLDWVNTIILKKKEKVIIDGEEKEKNTLIGVFKKY